MVTARDIILLSLKQIGAIGVGQTPSAEDINDAFSHLNMMIQGWNATRYNVFHLQDIEVVGNGIATRTIGPTGQIVNSRPYRIDSAYVRLNPTSQSPADIYIKVLQSKEDYNQISVKNITSIPSIVFLDTTFPNSTLYMWPIPTNQYTVFLSVLAELEQFDNLSDVINLPGVYMEAILFNLCLRIAPLFGIQCARETVVMAKQSLSKLKMSNAQIPTLKFNTANGTYGVFSDTYGPR